MESKIRRTKDHFRLLITGAFASAVLVGCGGSIVLERYPKWRLQEGRERSYTLLLQAMPSYDRAYLAEIVQNTRSLDLLWTRWRLRDTPPEVDFARNIVMVWGIPARGEERADISFLNLEADGTIWAEQPIETRRSTASSTLRNTS